MRTIGTSLLLLFLVVDVCGQASQSTTHSGLDSVSWENANARWTKKLQLIRILTTDSTEHIGQILAVSDSVLLMYEDDGLPDITRSDSLVHSYLIDDVTSIFFITDAHVMERTPVFGTIGTALGVVVGTSLHIFLPGNVFHPVFIAPIAGAGLLGGLGIGARKNDTVHADTVIICTREHFKDTAAPNESELIWSTYPYTIWQDSVPEGVLISSSGVEVDSMFTFEALVESSRNIKRTFPLNRLHVSVSEKFTATKYTDILTAESMWMLNAGCSLGKWSVDVYYSVSNVELETRTPEKQRAAIDGTHGVLCLSYLFVKRDRFAAQPFQFGVGLGAAFSTYDFHDNISGYDKWYANTVGAMAKLDFQWFFSSRLSLVADLQQTFFQNVMLPQWDWSQISTTSANGEIFHPAYTQFGLGMRFHF